MLAEGAHKGIEVRVLTTDGVPFVEHQVVHEEEDMIKATSTCFLEIEEGRAFKIEVLLTETVLDGYHSGAWAAWVLIDGKNADRIYMRGIASNPRRHNFSTKQMTQDGQSVRGDLQFSRMATVSVGSGENRNACSKSLGDIKIIISPVKIGSIFADHTPLDSAQPGIGVAVKETDAKRTGSSVTTTNVRPVTETASANYTRQKDRTQHTFIFKYRTRTMLEMLKVIELPDATILTQKAVPSVTSRSLKRKRTNSAETGTHPVPDAQLEMYETMLAMRRELSAVRAEMRDMRKKESVAQNKVVDLTGDDSD